MLRFLVAVFCLAALACSSAPTAQPAGTPTVTPARTATERPPATVKATPSARPDHRERPAARPRPSWLGTRILPRRPDGYGEIRPTPKVLRNRRLASPDLLPPPPNDRFSAAVRRVPGSVLRRSTWSAACPVSRNDLRYVTLTFWGFDGRAHTGEVLVSAQAARDLVGVFRTLYRERFPIEEMRVVAAPELELPPTGDGNNTTAFVCRPTRGSSSWSQHAYGLAIDVNPFHNPYAKGDVVLPELASAYRDRSWRRPGMHRASSASVRAFAAIGWGWGGTWEDPTDPMHFSSNGR